MEDKKLQQFHTQYKYVIRLPIWDDFLLPFHPHGNAQNHILINTNQFLYVWCNQAHEKHNRTSVVNHTSDNITAASFPEWNHPPLPDQVGIYYTLSSPYSRATVNAGILLLCCIRDATIPIELLANPSALLLLKNNDALNALSTHYPFLLTSLFWANQTIKLTQYQGHIRIEPLTNRSFFHTFSLFSSMQGQSSNWPQLQRPQLTIHRDHTQTLITTMLQEDNYDTIADLFQELQARYNFTRWTPPSTTDDQYSLSLTTHHAYKILLPKNQALHYDHTIQWDYQIHTSVPLIHPLISQAIPAGYCSAYTPKVLAQKYSRHWSTHTRGEYSTTTPLPGIVLDTLTGKIRIKGKSFTSKDLPSQKWLIEILTILLNKQSLVHNKELPPSSYSKNRNTFESKIALPFNKLLQSFGYTSVAIVSQWSLYDFTTSFVHEWAEITVITKPRTYAPSTSLIK